MGVVGEGMACERPVRRGTDVNSPWICIQKIEKGRTEDGRGTATRQHARPIVHHDPPLPTGTTANRVESSPASDIFPRVWPHPNPLRQCKGGSNFLPTNSLATPPSWDHLPPHFGRCSKINIGRVPWREIQTSLSVRVHAGCIIVHTLVRGVWGLWPGADRMCACCVPGIVRALCPQYRHSTTSRHGAVAVASPCE